MYKLIITLILSFSLTAVFAQDYQLIQQESEVMVIGTSNVHDWEAPAEEFSGTANIEINDDSLVSISSLNFSVTAEEINSGKGGMDKRIDDALKIKKHPKINFELSEITEMSNGVLSAIGTLNVAGVTKEVQMEVNYQIPPDGSIQFEGTHTIDMTNHEVDPPTAMFGTIKAGAKVDIKFSTKYTL